MGPPVRSKDCGFGYFGYFITQPLQAERLRSPAGNVWGGRTGMAEQRSGDH